MEGWTFRDAGTDLCPNPVLGPASLHCDAVVGLLDALVDGVHVHRSDGPEVDDLTTDSLLLQEDSSVQGEADPDGVAHYGDVCAWSHDLGLANGQNEVVFQDALVNIKSLTVEDLVLHEHHGVWVSDSSLQQSLAVLGVVGRQDLILLMVKCDSVTE